MIKIFIDADACPVKDETYKVAERYQLEVHVIANSWINVPLSPTIKMIVVDGGFDAADDYIVENAHAHDIVVTSDILLADRLVKNRVRVLGPKGEEFTEDNVGSAVANRELMQNLRSMGEVRGGPSAMDKKARSAYLSKLDQIVSSAKRAFARDGGTP